MTRIKPRLSVLMSVLNAKPYLADALHSVFSQSFEDFELLVVDDGSTDGSLDLLKSYDEPRLICLSDGVHRGPSGAYNLALERARGELVARMDADDLISPERFALQVKYLDQFPDVGVVGTQFTYIGKSGRPGFARKLPLDHQSIVAGLNRGEMTVIHASLMLRTKLLQSIGGYRLSPLFEDWDMFLRMAEITKFSNLTDCCYYYRLHDNNLSTSKQKTTLARIRYACLCAEARAKGQPEPSGWDFEELEKRGTMRERIIAQLDSVSVSRYFAGRSMVLNGRPIAGYFYLLLASTIAPWRLANRVNQFLRSA